MGKYKLEHDRPNCIGCAACAAIAPDFWKMDEEEGKSDIVNGKRLDNGQEEIDIEDKDFEINKEAAESCPVNVIHVRDKEKNERIV